MTNSSNDPKPPTIFTIGHSNVPAEKLVELLHKFAIQTVVDVRSTPYSQYSHQFDRKEFEKTLELAGITYRYAGDFLGGRPKDPTCYKNGQIPEGHADFLNLVDYPAVMTKEFFQKGIRRLLALARQGTVAVMCSEEDPAGCHRHHLISKYLMRQGVTVLHIRSSGNALRAEDLLDQPSLF